MIARRAFTLIEVLMVTTIIALLISIMIPSIAQAREMIRRAKCAAQLRGLANALSSYASLNGRWPDCGLKGDKIDTNNSLWLMVKGGQASKEHFACPSELATGRAAVCDADESADTGFAMIGKKVTMGYSYQVPHAPRVGYPGQEHTKSTKFAVMADRGPFDPPQSPFPPGGKPLNSAWTGGTSADLIKIALGKLPLTDRQTFNSGNHGGEGQNVLFRDGHVDWCRTPLVGVEYDNIYTRSDPGNTTLQGRVVGLAPDANSLPGKNDDSYLRACSP